MKYAVTTFTETARVPRTERNWNRRDPNYYNCFRQSLIPEAGDLEWDGEYAGYDEFDSLEEARKQFDGEKIDTGISVMQFSNGCEWRIEYRYSTIEMLDDDGDFLEVVESSWDDLEAVVAEHNNAIVIETEEDEEEE